MNKRPFALLLILTVVTCIGLIVTFKINGQLTNIFNIQTPAETPEIIVDYPQPDDVVGNPLIVRGRARGSWFFEGTFPLTLYYGVGGDFVDGYATAKGEWMTEDYVEFEAVLNYMVPPTNDGLLSLQRNNPSDLEGLHDSIQVKVRFH
ncbi:hypothetical protein A2380_00135 [candidate division WWE3 bacterium RIFOXYB1_FULL_43_24]|nr:MAG: hypothetical protein A2212_03200 [candidate division WWE3 bacterium RIFOXYA1_FULL_42_9]OGC69239.1 MAG: hypothetical protein A2380_00135 [candidate division WWE3 bacterium RIFOXYB1_FULL_43_24]OGC73361.1 MAG: hypothetical protein A2414_04245 [candidate division WWE3 bacterium RIFOXYC1_FULL_42_13]